MATKPNVIIGIPSSGRMMDKTTVAIAGAIIGAMKADIEIVDVLLKNACDVVSSRTAIVQDAIKKGATHLLFIDTDMMFGSDVIPRLLAHKKEIVACDYHMRSFPLKSTCEPVGKRSETELFECKYAATGLMMIDLSIIEKMKTPWFSFGRGKHGELTLGEDAWFCFTAGDSGFKTWVDPTIKVGHIGEYIY